MKSSRGRVRAATAALALVLAAVVLPAAPGAAAEAYEVHHVPTVDGAVIRVEVVRDTRFDEAGQPVLLTYSPYNSIGEPEPARDGVADRYVPRGYARAVADVLGTRGSTGCWDYGGAKEQQSGIDVVRWLAEQPWSNGNVGMLGVSYEGTTATMVAARGGDVPELKAIVPIAAISRWYGYAYSDGVRYLGNSRTVTDEGFDTPLAFDLGFGRTVAADPTGEHFADTVAARTGECGTTEHTAQAYSRSPDYGDFWLERDYIADPSGYRAAALVVHGWQDYNVKQDEALRLYEALPVDDPATPEVEGVPFKRLLMSQADHAGLPAAFLELQDRFLEHTLKGVANGVDVEEPVLTLGRSASGSDADYRVESAWPPAGTADVALHLGRSFDEVDGNPSPHPLVGSTGETGTLEVEPQADGAGWTHVNPGTVSEEMTLADPTNRGFYPGEPVPNGGAKAHGYVSLYHESEPLAADLRIAGPARLDAVVNVPFAGQHLTPILVEVLPDGSLELVQRGFLNLDYADGLGKSNPRTGTFVAQVRFLPQDYTFRAGNRIGVILQASNTVWAVPGNPGLVSYTMQPVPALEHPGTRLVLPVVDPPAAQELFAS